MDVAVTDEIVIVRLKEMPLADIRPLLDESHKQGFGYVEWLVNDFVDGANRFDQPGEALFAVYNRSQLIAIGGLSHDPYLPDIDVGRVRRVYVLSSWRRMGIGKRLVQQIIAEARLHFSLLTLGTFDHRGDKFYRALGFHAKPVPYGATHCMELF